MKEKVRLAKRFLLRKLSAYGLKNIARQTFWTILIRIASISVGLITVVVLSRHLGPSKYGVYAYIITVASVGAMFSRVGLRHVIVRDTSRGLDEDCQSLVQGVWLFSILVTIGAALLVGSISIFIYIKYLENQYTLSFLVCAGMLIPLFTQEKIVGAISRGMNKVVRGQIIETILRRAIFCIAILIIIKYIVDRLSVEMALYTHGTVALIALSIGSFMVYRAIPDSITKNIKYHFETREWMFAALPLFLAGSMHHVNRYADIVLLGLLSDSANVGIYKISSQISWTTSILMQAASVVMLPYISRLYASDRLGHLQTLVTGVTFLVFSITCVIFVFYIAFGDGLIRFVFGSEYDSAYWPMILLSFGQLVSAAFSLVDPILNMTNNERTTATIVTATAIINILMNMLLIPMYGLEGAALATTISVSCWNLAMWYFVGEKLRINASVMSVLSAR